MQKVIVVTDIETGGFSMKKNGICEIAFLVVDAETLEVVNMYDGLISPYERDPEVQESEGQLVSYKEDAMAVNGISEQDLIDFGFSPKEFCHFSLELLGQFEIVAFMGHNINSFDKRWLEYFYGRFAEQNLDFSETICTLKLAREKVDGSHKLVDLCAHFEIESNESHRALSDCYDTLNVYKKLI